MAEGTTAASQLMAEIDHNHVMYLQALDTHGGAGCIAWLEHVSDGCLQYSFARRP